MTLDSFFTWPTLLTVSGAAAATAYIVQFLKNFSFFKKVNSQLVSFVVALLILTAATYFTGKLTPDTAGMIPISAIVVCFAANGAYDSVQKSIKATSETVESLANEIAKTFAAAFATIQKSIESIGGNISGTAGDKATGKDNSAAAEIVSAADSESEKKSAAQEIKAAEEIANTPADNDNGSQQAVNTID
jgi:hypothetical protein